MFIARLQETQLHQLKGSKMGYVTRLYRLCGDLCRAEFNITYYKRKKKKWPTRTTQLINKDKKGERREWQKDMNPSH